MKSCRGCKFLVHASNFDVCKADDGPWEWVTDPYSGRRSLRSLKGWMRPTLAQMRAEGAKCGPDARLYQPTLFRRLLTIISPP